jgi:hypothetical protein
MGAFTGGEFDVGGGVAGDDLLAGAVGEVGADDVVDAGATLSLP